MAFAWNIGGRNLILGTGVAGRSAPNTANAAAAGITITSRHAEQVAPEAITFEVDLDALSGFTASAPTGTEIWDARYHEIEYFWDFYYEGTDNSYLYAAPVNIYDGNDAWPNGYKNSRFALGYQATHVYRVPGTYTVRLTAYEPQSGKTAHATQSVTIGVPDTLFSGTNTIFISPSGDFTDAPSGAQTVTTGAIHTAIQTYIEGADVNTPKRLMLNRGESYTMSGFSMGNGVNIPTTHIVAGAGAGAKPAVTWSGSAGWSWRDTGTAATNGKDFVVQNIEFTGPFDATTAVDGSPNDFTFFSGADPGFVTGDIPIWAKLFDGVKVSDFSYFIEDQWLGESYVLNDCITEGIGGGAGIWRVNVFACLGSRFESDGNSNVDSAPGNTGWLFRLGPSNAAPEKRLDTIIHSCDMYNREDWNNTFPQNLGQACIRINSDVRDGTKVNVHGSCFEGGRVSLESRSSGSPVLSCAVNGLIRCNYILGKYSSQVVFDSDQSGYSVQNNIFVVPQQVNESLNGPLDISRLISFDVTGSPSADVLNAPIRVSQNTLVNLRTDNGAYEANGNQVVAVYLANFNDMTDENNVFHQPNTDIATTTYAPLADAVNTYFTARETGYKDSSTALQTGLASSTTAGQTDLYAPETGSSAIGAASTGLTTWRDFRGVVRPTIATNRSRSQSAGAIEPDLAS